MDETGRAAGAADLQARIEALSRENLILKKMVVELNERLVSERKQFSIERDAARLLRKANSRLVKATFLADDQRICADLALQRQSGFLVALSQQLRNPIASIAVAATVIDSLKLCDRRLARMTAIVQRQADHALRLVDDLRDVSALERGSLPLQARVLDLHHVIDNALASASASLAGRGQEVVLDLPPQPLPVTGDAVRLAQLFATLLENAGKLSAAQQVITLAASVHDASVTLVVSAQGGAVTPPDEAGPPGLDIGLALVRAIAQLHGGAVTQGSAQAGCGSVLSVMLPLAWQEQRATSATAVLRPAKVL